MKQLWLLLAMAVPLQFIHAQVEHAPTVEQCRAGQKLWLSKEHNCEKVDPNFDSRYDMTTLLLKLLGAG